MNISDTLLVKMIEKDMLNRDIAEISYIISEDKVVEKPTQISVRSNELVYLCYFSINTLTGFSVEVVSGLSQVTYTPNTTKINQVSSFESSVITTHNSTITFNNLQDSPFFIRYVKVVFIPNISYP